MKFKKVLASALAAAMALTTMVTTSFTASAADITVASNITVTSGTYDAEGGCEVLFDGYGWTGTSYSCDDHLKLEMTFEATDWGNAKCIALIINSGETETKGTGYVQQTAWWAVSGENKNTIDFSDTKYEGSTFNVIGYKVYRADGNTDAEFNGNITIKSVAFSGEKDTTVYAAQDITSYYADGEFNGIFDMSKVSGPNAKMEVTFTTSGAYGGIKLLDKTDVDAGNYDNPVTTIQGDADPGEYTKVIKLADISIPENLYLNSWGVASIDSVVIYNAEDAGNVFTVSTTDNEEPDEPEVDEPEVDEPEVDEPEVDEPEVDEPEVDEPEVDEPEVDEPEVDEPEVDEPEVDEPVVENKPLITTITNVISSVTVPANSAKKFEITDPVTGKTISASVNKLAKSLSKLTDGSELAFDTGDFGLVLRKNVIKEIVDNNLTLTITTSKATFIIDAENLAKVKTINIPAIMKTTNFKKLLKEGNTFNVIVTEKNKVEIELA